MKRSVLVLIIYLFTILLTVSNVTITFAFIIMGSPEGRESLGSYSGRGEERQYGSEMIVQQESTKRQLHRIENELRRQNGEIYFNEGIGKFCRDRGMLGFYLTFC